MAPNDAMLASSSVFGWAMGAVWSSVLGSTKGAVSSSPRQEDTGAAAGTSAKEYVPSLAVSVARTPLPSSRTAVTVTRGSGAPDESVMIPTSAPRSAERATEVSSSVMVTHATTAKPAQIASLNSGASAAHKLVITVLGTAGHPRVDIDAFVVLAFAPV